MPDTPTQMKIFVSHSFADNRICDQLVIALRGAGADVWYDEHNLGAGVLRREIMKELAARPITLVLLSKAALTSDWVQDECEWAYNLSKRKPERLILPVVVGTYDSDAFDALLYLESMYRIQGLENQPYPAVEMIARTLNLLALTPQGENAVAVAPEPGASLDDLLTQGKALSSQNKHAEALPFFERATQLDPTSFDAWVNLGYTFGELRRWDEALPACERATRIDPTSAGGWNNAGAALNGLQRYEAALVAYDRALAIEETTSRWTNKGNTLNSLGRYEEALAAYEKALAIDPDYAIALNGKAWQMCMLRRYNEALPVVEQSLKIHPANANALDTKGYALLGLRRYEESLWCFDRALAGDSTLRGSWEGRAAALRALGREAEAQEAEQRATALSG